VALDAPPYVTRASEAGGSVYHEVFSPFSLFVVFVRRCLLLRLKLGAFRADFLEVLLICAVAATLSFSHGGRNLELVDVPTLAFLRSLALALLASLSSLKVLGTSQLFLRREQQSGLSGALFCAAAMTVDLTNVILRPCVFTLVFQISTQPEARAVPDALANISIYWCFSGLTHMIVALVPYNAALSVAALLPLFTCFFSGVSPALDTLKPVVAAVTWLSPSRWSSTVLGYLDVLEMPTHISAIKDAADQLQWSEANALTMGYLLMACGAVCRCVAVASKLSRWRNATPRDMCLRHCRRSGTAASGLTREDSG
jgi:hypothetical protein